MVSIGFSYVQTKGDANPSPVDPSKAATEDPVTLADEKKKASEQKGKLTEGNEHEASADKPSAEEIKKTETESS